MNKPALQFGTATGINVGFNAEIKENLSMKDGLATVDTVDLQEKSTEDGDEPYPVIALKMKGVEGGGCYDSVTSRTPSKTLLGLERLKYLFNALGATFPSLSWFIFAISGASNRVTDIVVTCLQDYAARGGEVATAALLDSQNRIIISSLSKFREIFGDDAPVSYMFANLGKVGDMRAKHQAALNKITDEAERALAKTNYYAALDAEPVVPCEVDQESFKALYEATSQLPKDAPIYVKTGNNGRQVKAYMVPKES